MTIRTAKPPPSKHPESINKDKQSIAPWESLCQIDPKDLPESVSLDTYPIPWTMVERGNGHVDLIDANNRMFAHVFLWDAKDWDILDAFIQKHHSS